MLPMAMPRLRAGREEQHPAGRDVLLKDRKHRALFVLVEMEKTVPSDDGVEAAAQRKPTHVGLDPGGVSESAPGRAQSWRRSVDTGDVVSAVR